MKKYIYLPLLISFSIPLTIYTSSCSCSNKLNTYNAFQNWLNNEKNMDINMDIVTLSTIDDDKTFLENNLSHKQVLYIFRNMFFEYLQFAHIYHGEIKIKENSYTYKDYALTANFKFYMNYTDSAGHNTKGDFEFLYSYKFDNHDFHTHVEKKIDGSIVPPITEHNANINALDSVQDGSTDPNYSGGYYKNCYIFHLNESGNEISFFIPEKMFPNVSWYCNDITPAP